MSEGLGKDFWNDDIKKQKLQVLYATQIPSSKGKAD